MMEPEARLAALRGLLVELVAEHQQIHIALAENESKIHAVNEVVEMLTVMAASRPPKKPGSDGGPPAQA